jgi:hypothetical protein
VKASAVRAQPPAPKKTPEEARAAATRMRTRRVQRAIVALQPRQAEIVAFMLQATGGKGWPWPKNVHVSLAERFGVSRLCVRDYLGALRRTLGLPVVNNTLN